ncbi:Myotubularin [Hondaea fermentalgiana]|uniref:Myotubularin n=1 Tax=Hondaea fermentalgiana TaxID=2315210 RepID=A0A2R5GS15_9STRA|nr:Myotubularin [Hondaea fermentalgiana]|eukprot:GBG33677.1 Myotubularin [Hondaea fermentalgiana]
MSEREGAAATWRDLSGAVEWSWTPDRALAQKVRRGTRDSTAGEAESAPEEKGFVSFQALKRSKLRLKQRLLVLHETLDVLLLVNPEGRAKKIPIRCILRLDAEEDNKLPFRRLFGPSEFGFTLEISIASLDDDERKLSISTRTFMFRSAEDRSKLVQKVRALISHGSFTPPLCAEKSASAFLSDATVCARVEVPLAAIHEIRIEGIRLQIVTNDLRTLVFCCDMNANKLAGLRDLLLERKTRVQIAFTLLQGLQERSWEDWACWHPRQELEILNCALEEAATRVGTPAQDRLVLRLHDQTSAFRTCTSYPRFLAQLVSKLVQPSQRLFIVDARGRPAVLGNTLQGRGLERASSYQGATIQLCQIGNIHTMRGSVTEVALAFESPSDGVFWERIQNSHWLAHIAGILSASEYVARRLHNGEGSVLVHCSDGFDRTPQLVCMARIILDANARTIDGFCQLLAVEWCSFGHKFAQRSSSRGSSEFSPIFVQFLDAVHNLVRQQPDVFEFNERLLVFLAEHTYSARFGNFLHDSDMQRIKENVAQRTASIWFEILSSNLLRGRFTNPRYLPMAGPVWPHRGALRLVPFFAFFDAEHRERDGPIVEVEALTCSSEIAHCKSDSSVSSESTILPS